jgi:hypothetical protein
MAFKGESDNTLYLTQYISQVDPSPLAPYWTTPVPLPSDMKSHVGLALLSTGAGNVKIVSKGESDGALFASTYTPGGGWSPRVQVPGIQTRGQPALTSSMLSEQNFATQLAVIGEDTGNVYVGTLDVSQGS